MSQEQDDHLTRRAALAAGVAGAAALAGGPEDQAEAAPKKTERRRMPVAYVPHGGGPWPFVELDFFSASEKEALARYLSELARSLPARPEALLVVSAHWEAAVPTLMTAERPPLFYDYYGFPEESYAITWPAPGAPGLAARVQALLSGAGMKSAADPRRGFDHGTFIPLKLTFPEADVPTTQLSLLSSLDPAAHFALGRALAPLRDEGVFIVGSGMSYHNMRGFGGRGRRTSEVFDAWLQQAALAAPAERQRALVAWATAPEARGAHPREEHLLPLMVVAGAAGADPGQLAYNDLFAGTRLSAFHYG